MENTHVEAAIDSEQYLALIRRLAAAQGTATTSEIGEEARSAAVSEIQSVMDAIRRSPFSLDQLGRVQNIPTSDTSSTTLREPDPCTKGWLAALADAVHHKSLDSHSKKKLRDVLEFLATQQEAELTNSSVPLVDDRSFINSWPTHWIEAAARAGLANYNGSGEWVFLNDEMPDMLTKFGTALQQREGERCALLCEAARPHGGRAWSTEQAACFEALTHVAKHIRETHDVKEVNMSKSEIQRGNWTAVLGTLLEAKKHLQKDGVRHSWLDGSIGIAKQGAQLPDTDVEAKHAQTVGERQDLKNQEANSLALQAVSLALADAHAKLSNPNAISSNIDEVRWAEAMQSLETLSGKDSGEYYDSVATKRPYLIQKCTQEVERGIVKTLGYRAILNLSYSNGDLSTTAVFGCKPDALNHLEAAVASANDHVVDIQMGYPATPELLTSMSLIKAIQDRGLELPLSRFEVPGVQAETLPVIWRTWLNQDHQHHCDIELQGTPDTV